MCCPKRTQPCEVQHQGSRNSASAPWSGRFGNSPTVQFPLTAIAKQLNQPIAKVQQATFRLMLAGLVEELPLITSTSNVKEPPILLEPIEEFPEESKQAETAERSKVSNSFLQNLVGFLRSKS